MTETVRCNSRSMLGAPSGPCRTLVPRRTVSCSLSRPQRQNPGKNAGRQDQRARQRDRAQFADAVDPPSRGHPQQIGDTPDDIILEFIHSTVGIHNFPHHLNEPATTFVVQKLIELVGEMVEIDGGPVDRADSWSSLAVAGSSRSKCDLRTT